MPPGFRASSDLGDEEIVQRQLSAAIVELDVGERRVADHGVDAAAGGCRGKLSMRMSASGCRARAMRPEMESSSTPMNRMPAGAWLMKLPVPQPGSSTRALAGTPRRRDRPVHGVHDDGRGEELAEGGPLGGVVFLGRQQGFELVAEGLPAGVLVAEFRSSG